MYIKTTVKNPQISLENIFFKFSEVGVHIISGENGSGKTSILKKIVFEEIEIEFDNQKYKELFSIDRSNVFGYIEQDPLPYDISLYKYLTRMSDNVSQEKMYYYLKQFNMEGIDVRRSITKLSGGELTKANIISTLLKETPYIFMDEPTNNMDNESVRQFIKIITEYAKTHSVIMVSHDPRVDLPEKTVYYIEDGKVHRADSQPIDSKTVPSVSIEGEHRIPIWKIIKDYLLSINSLFGIAFMAAALVLIVFANYVIYYSTMATEDTINARDIIIGYKADEQYEELNKIYTSYEGILVDESKYYQMVYFADIKELLEKEYIEDILIPDKKYIDEIYESFAKETIEKVYLFSLPEKIINNFYGQVSLPTNIVMLEKGRLPKDSCNEVVLSRRILEEYYSIYDENPIGIEVEIEGKNYTLVGIGYVDVAVVSYEASCEYGYLSMKVSSDRIEEIEAYLVEVDYFIKNGTVDEIFIVKEGYEKDTLNYLIENYPAENYISYEFQKTHSNAINDEASRNLYIINVVMILILGMLIIFMDRQKLKIYNNKSQSIDNYYCKVNFTKTIYKKVNFMVYTICTCMTLVIVCIGYNEIFEYCCIGLVIGEVVQLVKLAMGRKSNV